MYTPTVVSKVLAPQAVGFPSTQFRLPCIPQQFNLFRMLQLQPMDLPLAMQSSKPQPVFLLANRSQIHILLMLLMLLWPRVPSRLLSIVPRMEDLQQNRHPHLYLHQQLLARRCPTHFSQILLMLLGLRLPSKLILIRFDMEELPPKELQNSQLP